MEKAELKARLFTYAWDLDSEGYEEAVARIADAGFTSVNLATSYHDGRFLLPRNPRHRVYFAEDGAIFFPPDLAKYGRIHPRVHSLVREGDHPVGNLLAAVERYGLSYTAWTVCLHNSWLGARYPDATMHTAFGDPLIHSLSPAHGDVREYIIALVSDLVDRYDVEAIQLESPGYMRFEHEYHHDKIGVHLDAVQLELLGLSFNPVELSGARSAGIDADWVRRRVSNLLDDSWNQGTSLMEEGAPSEVARSLLNDDEYAAYKSWLSDQAISLAQELRDAVKAINPDVQVFHFAALDGSDHDRRLLSSGDGILAGYASSDEDAIRRARLCLPYGKPVFGAVRAIAPDFIEPSLIGPRLKAWHASGVEGVDIYNYGLIPGSMWQEISKSLQN